MRISIILLLLIIVALFEHHSTFHFYNGLIYNGEIFDSHKYPYIMFLKFKYGPKKYSKCTGSLIQKLLVLTAAHCCSHFKETDVEVNIIILYLFELCLTSYFILHVIFKFLIATELFTFL